VIMGAAVKPDGEPSGALRRRVEGALALGRNAIAPYYLVTGGQGKFGPPEADVMQRMLLQAGVAEDHIIADRTSSDTLASVIECGALLKRRPFLHPVIVCTDIYHVPRCRWLFRMLGISTEQRPMPSGREANGVLRWFYYYFREFCAILWDTFLLAVRLSVRTPHRSRPGNE
jgi:vancomycin permeability regulator SanA